MELSAPSKSVDPLLAMIPAPGQPASAAGEPAGEFAQLFPNLTPGQTGLAAMADPVVVPTATNLAAATTVAIQVGGQRAPLMQSTAGGSMEAPVGEPAVTAPEDPLAAGTAEESGVVFLGVRRIGLASGQPRGEVRSFGARVARSARETVAEPATPTAEQTLWSVLLPSTALPVCDRRSGGETEAGVEQGEATQFPAAVLPSGTAVRADAPVPVSAMARQPSAAAVPAAAPTPAVPSRTEGWATNPGLRIAGLAAGEEATVLPPCTSESPAPINIREGGSTEAGQLSDGVPSTQPRASGVEQAPGLVKKGTGLPVRGNGFEAVMQAPGIQVAATRSEAGPRVLDFVSGEEPGKPGLSVQIADEPSRETSASPAVPSAPVETAPLSRLGVAPGVRPVQVPIPQPEPANQIRVDAFGAPPASPAAEAVDGGQVGPVDLPAAPSTELAAVGPVSALESESVDEAPMVGAPQGWSRRDAGVRAFGRSTPRAMENFADSEDESAPGAIFDGEAVSKHFQMASDKDLVSTGRRVGTDTANSSEPMVAYPFISRANSEAAAPVRIEFAPAGAASANSAPTEMPDVPAEVAATAQRAVDAVLSAAERLAQGERSSVKLQFAMGDTEVSVRVERHETSIHATFHSKSAELCAALTRECQAISFESPERAFRLETSVVSGGGATQSSGFSSSSGDASAQQRDAQQRRAAGLEFGSSSVSTRAMGGRREDETAPAPVRSGSLPTSRHLHTLA